MSYALFLFYLPIFCWLLTKSRLVKKSGLSTTTITLLYILKIFIGCSGYYILGIYSDNSDAYGFHKRGLLEYHLLFNDPKEYFVNIFQSNYNHHYGEFLGVVNSYWNDLGSTMIEKLLSIFNIFSGGNYYIDEIFFNYGIFLATVAMFTIFKKIYPGKVKLLIVGCFLLPSFILYSSYSYKDALIFALLICIIFNFGNFLNENKRKPRSIIVVIIGLFFLGILRSYLSIVILPAICAWYLCYRLKYNPVIIFAGIYFLGAIFFFTASAVSPALNLPQSIADRQSSFRNLQVSHTLIKLDTLQPAFKSFIQNAPQAISHVLARPFLADYSLSVTLIPFALEILSYQIILLIFIFFKEKGVDTDPFILFLYFFSLSVFMVIGYTIPVIGAFIRYRSIYLPFIITPLICRIEWRKLGRFIHII